MRRRWRLRMRLLGEARRGASPDDYAFDFRADKSHSSSARHGKNMTPAEPRRQVTATTGHHDKFHYRRAGRRLSFRHIFPGHVGILLFSRRARH